MDDAVCEADSTPVVTKTADRSDHRQCVWRVSHWSADDTLYLGFSQRWNRVHGAVDVLLQMIQVRLEQFLAETSTRITRRFPACNNYALIQTVVYIVHAE